MREWPVGITSLGGAVCGTLVWRNQGRHCVTVVVKVTFAIVHGGEMVPVEPTPLVLDDEHRSGRPTRSLRVAGELAPYLGKVDVWLTGNACTAPGQPASSTTARLSLARHRELLIDKSILVRGEWTSESAGPKPFQHMPLVYERALGGSGSEENPAGVGLAPGYAPNLLDPLGRPCAACFAPIPRRWPVRATLLGDLDPGALEAPIPVIPKGFDWTYFQAAPPDQRIDKLHGDEVLLLYSMHPELARVESRLPSARAEAKVYGPGLELESGKPIDLRADTLSIDVNLQTCTILWRGHFPAEGLDLGALEVVAGVELPNRPLAWPRREQRRPSTPVAAEAAPLSSTLQLTAEEVTKRFADAGLLDRELAARGRGEAPVQSGTIRLTAADVARQLAAAGLPFEREPAVEERVEAPARPTVEREAKQVRRSSAADVRPSKREPAAQGSGATLDLKAEDMRRISTAAVLPFKREPVAQGSGATLDLKAEDMARIAATDVLPFKREPAAPGHVESPVGATLRLEAADVARISAADALPFERPPAATLPRGAKGDAVPPPPMIGPLATPEMAAPNETSLANEEKKPKP